MNKYSKTKLIFIKKYYFIDFNVDIYFYTQVYEATFR